MTTAQMSMMMAWMRPRTVSPVDTITITILSPMVLRFVMATGEARWSLVKGLRLQSLMDYRAASRRADANHRAVFRYLHNMGALVVP
jgi:hypothetical protein